ncbi:hypothetical protein [Nocardia sp. BMG51109]|uniref:hypothetical protein n=1 Tax=Nocardia sp. BMG51109 TaxID=1056816 RepID=UPI0004644256|nr:hypothetical protein [Nocardia sp. BMG51109]
MKRTDLARRAARTVLAAGVVGSAAVGSAVDGSAAGFVSASPAVESASAPAVAESALLDVLPNPLNCLLTTGWAVFCLGIPLS